LANLALQVIEKSRSGHFVSFEELNLCVALVRPCLVRINSVRSASLHHSLGRIGNPTSCKPPHFCLPGAGTPPANVPSEYIDIINNVFFDNLKGNS
jgi:hypothetical protein